MVDITNEKNIVNAFETAFPLVNHDKKINIQTNIYVYVNEETDKLYKAFKKGLVYNKNINYNTSFKIINTKNDKECILIYNDIPQNFENKSIYSLLALRGFIITDNKELIPTKNMFTICPFFFNTAKNNIFVHYKKVLKDMGKKIELKSSGIYRFYFIFNFIDENKNIIPSVLYSDIDEEKTYFIRPLQETFEIVKTENISLPRFKNINPEWN